MTKKYLKHISYDIDPVVRFLIDTIPSDTWDEIEAEIQASEGMWKVDMHFGFGMYVRNLIYESKIPVPPMGLDLWWDVFLEAAMRKRRISMRTGLVRDGDSSIE